MSIRIITDSTCDLPDSLVRKYRIKVIPLYINIGSNEYRDGIDITRQAFYEQLPGYNPIPTTAVPGLDIFRQAYEQLAAEGANEILSIHISEKLSAVLDTARLAARETTSAAVTVYDSRQLSLGTGFLVLTAARAAAQNCSLPEIIALLEDQVRRTHVFAVLDTLEFLRRSGRMNGVLSAMGSLLQIKPILKMYDGNPSAERVRTRARAVKRLLKLLGDVVPLEQVAVVHTNALERAKELLAQARQFLPEGEVMFTELNPVLGTHVGPGVIGFVCVTKQ